MILEDIFDEPLEQDGLLADLSYPTENQFCPTGAGGGRDNSCGRGQLKAARRRAVAKFIAAKKPTPEEVAEANRRMDEEGADRYESNIRGNTSTRASSRARLLSEFGDGETCPCIYCGLKLDDSSVTRDKMYTARQGGRYRQDNLVPACLACNKSRSDTPFGEIKL